MVLPVGFFMPLPLAMMIPFMGIQSAVMAKQFGENFQYGKRRISAMSNEEFNKLTPQKLQENANEELKSMIPSMQQTIVDMHAFQQFLIKEFIDMLTEFIHDMPGNLLKILGIDPSILGEHPTIEEPPKIDDDKPPESDLIHFTQGQILDMTHNQVDHWFNNQHLLDNSTRLLIIEDKERRHRVADEPPFDDDDFEPPNIFTVTESWLQNNSPARLHFRSGARPWVIQTNPQLNGNWQTKISYIAYVDATNRLRKDFPIGKNGAYNHYGFKRISPKVAQWTNTYVVLKSKVKKEQDKLK